MRYLKLSSLLFLLLTAACSNPYKKLQLAEKSGRSAFAYKPMFNKPLCGRWENIVQKISSQRRIVL
jgi:hypothetical protein